MPNQIPQLSWYNAIFLISYQKEVKSSPNKTLQEFFNEFLSSHELQGSNFTLENKAHFCSCLYTLLVVPREMWEKDRSKGTSFKFISKNYFKFSNTKHLANSDWNSIKFANLSNWDFIRLMRNSVSHVNFETNLKENKWVFWNMSTRDVKNFEIEILHPHLGDFIDEIAHYYVNEVQHLH